MGGSSPCRAAEVPRRRLPLRRRRRLQRPLRPRKTRIPELLQLSARAGVHVLAVCFGVSRRQPSFVACRIYMGRLACTETALCASLVREPRLAAVCSFLCAVVRFL